MLKMVTSGRDLHIYSQPHLSEPLEPRDFVLNLHQNRVSSVAERLRSAARHPNANNRNKKTLRPFNPKLSLQTTRRTTHQRIATLETLQVLLRFTLYTCSCIGFRGLLGDCSLLFLARVMQSKGSVYSSALRRLTANNNNNNNNNALRWGFRPSKRGQILSQPVRCLF